MISDVHYTDCDKMTQGVEKGMEKLWALKGLEGRGVVLLDGRRQRWAGNHRKKRMRTPIIPPALRCLLQSYDEEQVPEFSLPLH